MYMIFFNVKKIHEHGQLHADQVKSIIEYITYRPIPSSRGDFRRLKYQSIDWFGESFLINPEPLLDHWHEWKERELLQYIFVAARRRYTDYKVWGVKTKDTINVNTKVLENNRLLTITGNEIHFKYEEL
jgi:hypothetical protein